MADIHMLEAVEWSQKLEKGTGDPRRFIEWRGQPGNEDAWRKVEKTFAAIASVADEPEMIALRHATLARVARNAVQRRTRFAISITIGALIAAVAPFAIHYAKPEPQEVAKVAGPVQYATGRGQRLNVVLPDGSTLTLDTASKVELAYTGSERRLVLKDGQALFEVAKNQARPFVVVAGDRQIVAHGTLFDVRLDPASLRVALVEGKISVATPHQPVVAMKPDDLMTVTSGTVAVSHVPGQAKAFMSWSNGQLSFSNERLATAISEINRYAATPILVDASAADLRISGSFRTGETELFLEGLQQSFPLVIRHSRTGETIVAMQHS